MLKDTTFNELMEPATVEPATVISKGLHRYATFMKDAGDCSAVQGVLGPDEAC